MPGACQNNPFPATATKAKTGFNNRHDGQASGIFEHRLRNSLLRHSLEALNNRGRLIDVSLHAGVDWGGTQPYNTARQYSDQYIDRPHNILLLHMSSGLQKQRCVTKDYTSTIL